MNLSLEYILYSVIGKPGLPCHRKKERQGKEEGEENIEAGKERRKEADRQKNRSI